MPEEIKFFSFSRRIVASILILFMIIYSVIGIFDNSFAASKTYKQNVKAGIEAFPKDYQESLKQIQKDHPNWTFDAYYTGIDWEDLVANETNHGHNRIHQNSNSLWKCSCGNVATGYACASKDIIKYYMDPRNFLNNDVKIFQFLEISYNEKIHTTAGITSVIKRDRLHLLCSIECIGGLSDRIRRDTPRCVGCCDHSDPLSAYVL